jgi:multiple sugar transport system ATP-binding protein
MTLGDRVAVLNDGRLQQVDPPQRLYDFPSNRFVAEFIGDPAMNILPVEVEGGTATHDAFEIPVPGYEGPAGSSLLGIRPEDFEYVESDQPGRETFEADVTVTEPLGDTLLLYCRAGGEEFKVQSNPRLGVGSGDSVRLSYDPERLHLFAPDNGEARYHSATATQAKTQPLTD